MAANINIGDRYQLNTIVPQDNNRRIVLESGEQRIAAQNIARIDKKIVSIDKEIEVTENLVANNNRLINAYKESKKIIQEEMNMVISILQRRGVVVIKQNGVWVEDTNSLNGKISNSERDIDITKKVEMAKQKITESDKKIEAIEKHTQKLEVQPTIKKDVVVSSYKPTSTQLSTLVRYNNALNKSASKEINVVASIHTLPNIYQSQQNIYESIINSLLMKII